MWPLKILRVVAATRALSFQYDTLVTILWRAHTHRHILKWAEHMRQMNRCRVSFRTESRIRLKPLKERAQSVHFYTPSDKYQLAYIFLLNMYGFVVAMFDWHHTYTEQPRKNRLYFCAAWISFLLYAYKLVKKNPPWESSTVLIASHKMDIHQIAIVLARIIPSPHPPIPNPVVWLYHLYIEFSICIWNSEFHMCVTCWKISPTSERNCHEI